MEMEMLAQRKKQEAYVITQLARLQVFYGITIPEDRFDVYAEELGHLTPAQIDEAVTRIKRTWRPSGPNPYPPICEFLSAAGVSDDGGEYMAIAALRTATGKVDAYNSVSFCDPALHYVIRAYGGWVAICNWGQKEWDVNEGRLREAYREAKAAKADGGNHLAGLCEGDPSRRGRGDVVCVDPRTGAETEKIPFEDGTISLLGAARLGALCCGGAGTSRNWLETPRKFTPVASEGVGIGESTPEAVGANLGAFLTGLGVAV